MNKIQTKSTLSLVSQVKYDKQNESSSKLTS